jgi:hypothetical protein
MLDRKFFVVHIARIRKQFVTRIDGAASSEGQSLTFRLSFTRADKLEPKLASTLFAYG